MAVRIDPSWYEVLKDEFEQPYFQQIKAFLLKEKAEGKTVYPPGNLLFNAFDTTPFDQVKVIILGQDPYHNVGQAMGLSFSVPPTVTVPASLKNIYKEINQDLGLPIPKHGDLTAWAKQGVFLLNAMLTVQANAASSHKGIGWQKFTDAVIAQLSTQHEGGLIFLLWGNFAKEKSKLIDHDKHYVLEAAHPSPLAGGAFFGCKHFSKTNELLAQQGKTPIDWEIY